MMNRGDKRRQRTTPLSPLITRSHTAKTALKETTRQTTHRDILEMCLCVPCRVVSFICVFIDKQRVIRGDKTVSFLSPLSPLIKIL